MPDTSLHLFQAYGVELEYMIVDAGTLDVRPIADRLLELGAREAGAEAEYEEDSPVPTEVALGDVSWSNELTRHLVELKTTDPAAGLAGLGGRFQSEVQRIGRLLEPLGARLLPGAMHPWMDPDTELQLWPFGYTRFYETFNRIFDCRGHGWANLQAVHLNLAFEGDDEFGRLHAAVRALLPIMPGLAASSPVYGGRATGLLDNRMEVYRSNARAVPSVAGRVIPEPVFTRAEYERVILDRIYADLAPHDPEGLLRHEWANSRGCIARFERGAIEVRVLDVQECPAADLAVCAAVSGAVRGLCDLGPSEHRRLRELTVDRLEPILLACVRDGDRAVIRDAEYLRTIGIATVPGWGMTAGEAWAALIGAGLSGAAGYQEWAPALDTIARGGCLARRILAALDGDLGRQNLAAVYGRLAECLARGQLFGAD